jgi:hypothetical protein
MKKILLHSIICTVVLSGSLSGTAQTNKSSKRLVASTSNAKPAPSSDKTWRRKFWFFASVSSLFDSNINHDEDRIKSFGLVPSIGFHLQDSVENPSVEFEYEGALHRYTNTDKWDRFSNRFTGSYRKRIGRWVSRTEGEVLLKGSSEDRELNNWYSISQRIEYRLTRNDRLQVFASYRIRRDPLDPGSNSIDPYVGGRYIRRFGLRELELTYRYDKNRSWDPSNRYIRWLYEAQFETPVFSRRNRLIFEGTYKPRLFSKTVKVNGLRVPRRDERWIGEIRFERALRPDLDMTLGYRYETRDSNHPVKKFNSHLAGVGFNYRW